MSSTRPNSEMTQEEKLSHLKATCTYFVLFYFKIRPWGTVKRSIFAHPSAREDARKQLLALIENAESFHDWHHIIRLTAQYADKGRQELYGKAVAYRVSVFADFMHAIRNRIVSVIKDCWKEDYEEAIQLLLAEAQQFTNQMTTLGIDNESFEAPKKQRLAVFRQLCDLQHHETLIHHPEAIAEWYIPLPAGSESNQYIALPFQLDFFYRCYEYYIRDCQIRPDCATRLSFTIFSNDPQIFADDLKKMLAVEPDRCKLSPEPDTREVETSPTPVHIHVGETPPPFSHAQAIGQFGVSAHPGANPNHTQTPMDFYIMSLTRKPGQP